MSSNKFIHEFKRGDIVHFAGARFETIEDAHESFGHAPCGSCKKPGGSGGHMRSKIVAKTDCLTCGKRVKKAGLADHMRDVHGVKS